METAKLLNQEQAAVYLGTTVASLNTLRHYGKLKLPFVRWGNRIRYRREDLDAWIASRIENQSEPINIVK